MSSTNISFIKRPDNTKFDVEMSKNLSRNSLFGIELDIEGNAKISFDMKEKKNESNTLNWKTFVHLKMLEYTPFLMSHHAMQIIH